MSPELIAILVTAAIQIAGLVYIARIERDIHTETRWTVLALRKMRDSD
jgi:hypothetical protein